MAVQFLEVDTSITQTDNINKLLKESGNATDEILLDIESISVKETNVNHVIEGTSYNFNTELTLNIKPYSDTHSKEKSTTAKTVYNRVEPGFVGDDNFNWELNEDSYNYLIEDITTVMREEVNKSPRFSQDVKYPFNVEITNNNGYYTLNIISHVASPTYIGSKLYSLYFKKSLRMSFNSDITLILKDLGESPYSNYQQVKDGKYGDLNGFIEHKAYSLREVNVPLYTLGRLYNEASLIYNTFMPLYVNKLQGRDFQEVVNDNPTGYGISPLYSYNNCNLNCTYLPPENEKANGDKGTNLSFPYNGENGAYYNIGSYGDIIYDLPVLTVTGNGNKWTGSTTIRILKRPFNYLFRVFLSENYPDGLTVSGVNGETTDYKLTYTFRWTYNRDNLIVDIDVLDSQNKDPQHDVFIDHVYNYSAILFNKWMNEHYNEFIRFIFKEASDTDVNDFANRVKFYLDDNKLLADKNNTRSGSNSNLFNLGFANFESFFIGGSIYINALHNDTYNPSDYTDVVADGFIYPWDDDIPDDVVIDKYANKGYLVEGNKIRFGYNIGNDTFDVDLSNLQVNYENKYTTNGVLSDDGDSLRMYYNDYDSTTNNTSYYDIDVSKLNDKTNPIVDVRPGVNDFTMTFVYKDGSEKVFPNYQIFFEKIVTESVERVLEEIETIIKEKLNEAIQKIMDMGWNVKEVPDQNYTLTTSSSDPDEPWNYDLNGITCIVSTFNGNATINIPRPATESNKTVMIIKGNGDQDSLMYINCASGVSIIPSDFQPMRRLGNAITLMYIGNGVYRSIGELP